MNKKRWARLNVAFASTCIPDGSSTAQTEERAVNNWKRNENLMNEAVLDNANGYKIKLLRLRWNSRPERGTKWRSRKKEKFPLSVFFINETSKSLFRCKTRGNSTSAEFSFKFKKKRKEAQQAQGWITGNLFGAQATWNLLIWMSLARKLNGEIPGFLLAEVILSRVWRMIPVFPTRFAKKESHSHANNHHSLVGWSCRELLEHSGAEETPISERVFVHLRD